MTGQVPLTAPLSAVALAVAVALAACGERERAPERAETTGRPAATATATATATAAASPARQRFRPVRCPAALAGCRAVTGRVIYVEAMDPDGDGDAHYVLAGGDVTAPGLTVVDVAPRLRPRRLPRPGERVSAAGPVHTGSYGQRQIEALRLRHDRR